MGVVLRTERLTKRFERLTAVQDLDLEVREGEVFGFLGPNGAGKTTTLRLLCALIAPTSGTAEVAGFRLGREDERIRASVGILTEQPGLYERQSAEDNLLFFAPLRGEGRTVFLCTHNLDEADRLCDRIAFFRRTIIRIDTPARLRAELYGHATEFRINPSPRAEHLAKVQEVEGVKGAHLENGS